MEALKIIKKRHLTPHFTIGELIKTKHKTTDGNMPSLDALENLQRICEHWLEPLRERYNERYVLVPPPPDRGQVPVRNTLAPMADRNLSPVRPEPIIINSGFRSEEVNKMVGGQKTSNHLTGCAVDIRCLGPEQVYRYGCILIDIADETRQDFDELLCEHNAKGEYWLHLAVRPAHNRRHISFFRG